MTHLLLYVLYTATWVVAYESPLRCQTSAAAPCILAGAWAAVYLPAITWKSPKKSERRSAVLSR